MKTEDFPALWVRMWLVWFPLGLCIGLLVGRALR